MDTARASLARGTTTRYPCPPASDSTRTSSRKTCTLRKSQQVHEVMEADGEVRVRLSGGGKPPSPAARRDQAQGARGRLRMGERQVRVQAAPVAGFAEKRRGRARCSIAAGRVPGAAPGRGSAGLHPGLVGAGVGREVGRMVADSMRGGDEGAVGDVAQRFGSTLRREPAGRFRRGRACLGEELPDAPGDGWGGALRLELRVVSRVDGGYRFSIELATSG